MIELIDCLTNSTILSVCACIAFFNAYKSRDVVRRVWILFGLAAVEYVFSDIYNALFLIFYDRTPTFYIADISYYTSYLFMILLLLYVSERVSIRMMSWRQVLIPIFTVSMGIFFYVTSGDIFGNIVSVVEMTIAIWLATGGLELERQKARILRREQESGAPAAKEPAGPKMTSGPNKKPFYILCLVIYALEYGFWITSTYWVGDTLLNPYFWLDVPFFICYICMIPAIKMAVKEDVG